MALLRIAYMLAQSEPQYPEPAQSGPHPVVEQEGGLHDHRHQVCSYWLLP